jgi:hypothetical protein
MGESVGAGVSSKGALAIPVMVKVMVLVGALILSMEMPVSTISPPT